jgi:hypothetical protein
MKLLCCGSRHWTDINTVAQVLETFVSDTSKVSVIHGGQCFKNEKDQIISGADWICGQVAEQLEFFVKEYQTDWSLGPSAGPRRNQRMIDVEHQKNNLINLCIAFHDAQDLGRGTKDMVERCHKNNIPVRLVRSSNWHQKHGDRLWIKDEQTSF